MLTILFCLVWCCHYVRGRGLDRGPLSWKRISGEINVEIQARQKVDDVDGEDELDGGVVETTTKEEANIERVDVAELVLAK
jgi:hypothetical protein